MKCGEKLVDLVEIITAKNVAGNQRVFATVIKDLSHPIPPYDYRQTNKQKDHSLVL